MVLGLGMLSDAATEVYDHLYGGAGGGDEGPSLTHEALAGAVGFWAMKQYEKKREQEGHQDHSTAREMLAALTAAEVDRIAEEKGMDWEQKESAKAAARDQAYNMYNTSTASEGGGYGGGYGGPEGEANLPVDRSGGYGYEAQGAGYGGGGMRAGETGGYGGYGAQGGGYAEQRGEYGDQGMGYEQEGGRGGMGGYEGQEGRGGYGEERHGRRHHREEDY